MSTIDEQIAQAPLPTARTLRIRSSIPVQTVRFLAINLRMLRVIRGSHRAPGGRAR